MAVKPQQIEEELERVRAAVESFYAAAAEVARVMDEFRDKMDQPEALPLCSVPCTIKRTRSTTIALFSNPVARVLQSLEAACGTRASRADQVSAALDPTYQLHEMGDLVRLPKEMLARPLQQCGGGILAVRTGNDHFGLGSQPPCFFENLLARGPGESNIQQKEL